MRFSGKINLVVFLQATVVIIVFFLPTFASADTSEKESGTRNECFVVVSTGPFLASGYFYDGETHRCPKELTRDVTNPKHNPDSATMAQECNAWCEINRPGGPPNPDHRVFPYYLGDACEVVSGNLVSDPSESRPGPICTQRFCQQYKCLATYHESGSYESPFPFTGPELFKFYNGIQGFITVPLSTFDDVSQALSSTNKLLASAVALDNALSSPFGPAAGQKSSGSLTAQVGDSFFNGELTEEEFNRLAERLPGDAGAKTKLRKLLGSLIGALTSLKAELERPQALNDPFADLKPGQGLLAKAKDVAKRVPDYLTNLTQLPQPSFFRRAVNAITNTVDRVFGAKPTGEQTPTPRVVKITLESKMEVANKTSEFNEEISGPLSDILNFLRNLVFTLTGDFKINVSIPQDGKAIYVGERQKDAKKPTKVIFRAPEDFSGGGQATAEIDIKWDDKGGTMRASAPVGLTKDLEIKKRSFVTTDIRLLPGKSNQKEFNESLEKAKKDACKDVKRIAEEQKKENCSDPKFIECVPIASGFQDCWCEVTCPAE